MADSVDDLNDDREILTRRVTRVQNTVNANNADPAVPVTTNLEQGYVVEDKLKDLKNEAVQIQKRTARLYRNETLANRNATIALDTVTLDAHKNVTVDANKINATF